MRIVFFQFVQHHGGASRSCIEFASRLKAHVDVSIVDPYGGDENYVRAVKSAGIDFHILRPGHHRGYIGARGRPLRRIARLAAAVPELLDLQRRATRVISALSPTLICSDNIKSAFVIGTAPGIRRVPLVPFLRGWYLPSMMPWYGRWVCSSRAALVVAVSQATRAALMACGIDCSRIRVLHNPIDTNAMMERATAPLDAPLPQASRPVRLLLPASIVAEKGQHTAIAALKKIQEMGHDAVLWIAGDHVAFDANRFYVEELKRLAARLGIQDRVEFLGLRRDLPQVMAAASVIVLPSRFEGHPRVIIEAMALGKPIAASPAGGIMDMIIDGLTGRLFDMDDDGKLANCVDQFIRDPKAAELMGQTAQRYVRQWLVPDRHTERALEIFDEVACRQRRGV